MTIEERAAAIAIRSSFGGQVEVCEAIVVLCRKCEAEGDAEGCRRGAGGCNGCSKLSCRKDREGSRRGGGSANS